MQGVARITWSLITISLLALAFMGFSGLNV
jgi:Na+-translocating ferredoxin:NAD+ oxidoreductase RnfA subunit